MQRTDLIQLLRPFIAIPSTADNGKALHEALEYVLDFLSPGLTLERFVSQGKPSALVYPGTSRPEKFRLLLNAHVDVVPAQQFVARQEGDRLYGRGTADMKAACLAMAAVFKNLAKVVPYPIALQLVSDEEMGGHDGTQYQVETAGVRADCVLIGEFTNLKLTTRCKGMARLQLATTGTSSHGAYPWAGDNALNKLMTSLQRMQQTYPIPDKEIWRTTCNITDIHTPDSVANRTPAKAVAIVDMRFTDDDPNVSSPKKLLQWVTDRCTPGTQCEILDFAPGTTIPSNSPNLKRLQMAMSASGIEPSTIEKHGSSDARHFVKQGSEVLFFGPSGGGAHSDDEHLVISSLAPYVETLAAFVQKMA